MPVPSTLYTNASTNPTNYTPGTILKTLFTNTTTQATQWGDDNPAGATRLLEDGTTRYLETGLARILE